MQKDQIKLAGIIAGTIFIMAGVAFALSSGDGWRTTAVEGYEELAQCITDSGAKFYAAFWCPYCQEQKRVFGRGADSLPYIECSTPNGQGQLATCAEAEITSYPTWEFADGVRLSGALAPRSLAQLSGCPYPFEDVEVEGAEVQPTESSLAIGAEYNQLAQCITDSGAKFYGTFWCPYCKEQNLLFGSDSELLPYIECSTPDGQAQLEMCTEAGITSYPTWEFADGTRLSGNLSPATLAQATGCPLTDELKNMEVNTSTGTSPAKTFEPTSEDRS